MKIIDVDALFEGVVREFITKNAGKFTESEWEGEIPKLYEDFGSTAFDELGGLTPDTYYRSFSGEELVCGLKEHIEKGVSVSDFLCEAIIENGDTESYLCTLLSSDNEELVMYAMNILNDKNSVPHEKCIELILTADKQPIKELATELLSQNANAVKEKIIAVYDGADLVARELFAEILSNADKDDRVYTLLVTAFSENTDKIAQFTSYLVKYGDERAVKILTEEIEREDISYADFTELKFAIEALGGEYDKQRDFSNDTTYRKVKQASEKEKQTQKKK